MGEWLKSKVAVVTGAGGGLGRAVCLELASHGAKVVVNDLGVATDGTGSSTTPAQKVVDEIKKAGGDGVANYDSVASMTGGERIVKTALDAFGRVDILVTCAGILRDRMVFNMSEKEWDDVIAVHLKGTFACAKAASIAMRQQRAGRIITFTSTAGLYGNTGQANYSSAKSAIAGFTKVAALDLGRYGITVNSVAPMAATRMTMTEEYRKARALRAQRGIKREGFGAIEPQLDEMTPEEVAPVVAYLASDMAGFINGQVIYIGGPTIAWVAPPRIQKAIYKAGRWSVDELIEIVPNVLTRGIANPSPPVAAAAPAEQKK